jgi:glucose/arabinose dehydrogenase
VWHITRTIVFHDGRAYIAVGSGCNSCEQLPGALRGLIFSINPDGSDVEVYADGLRNAVGIEWAEGVLYATANGVDHLGASSPDDGMYRITKGEHYGWPYCYELNGVVQDDDSKTWTEAFSCGDAPHYLAAFGPHTAPLGLTYFKNAHEALEGAFLVAEHGSFNAGIGTGYQVTRVSKEGAQEVFMTGFLREDGWRIARPVDFLQKDENSFFMTDDHAGRIFYVYAR